MYLCRGTAGDFLFLFLNLFWPCCEACVILGPQPGIEPQAMAVKMPSPNH